MPVISVKIGKINEQQKQDLIQGLTVQAAKVTHVPEEAFLVLIEEFDEANVGIGGRSLAQRKQEKGEG